MIKTLTFIAIGLAVLCWVSGPSSDEYVEYRASCVNEIKIIPFLLRLDNLRNEGVPNAFETALKQHDEAISECVIITSGKLRYRIHFGLGEVHSPALRYGAFRLTECAIFSNTFWSCGYGDEGPRMVVVDGLTAFHAEAENTNRAPLFYQRRWQWWVTRIQEWLFGSASGRWLIPDQQWTK